jgi:hypothetical protein
MRILIASSAFYPENSPRSLRATELAKEFVRLGHNVVVLTVSGDSRTEIFAKENGIELKLISRSYKSIVIPARGILNLVARIINRILLLAFEYPDIELMFKYRKALLTESGYDLLISFAVPYPVHWGVGRAMRKNKNISSLWIADCGDPYMGLENDSFKKLFYFKYLEVMFCRKADYITIPVKEAITAYYPEFRNKIRVIPQGLSFPPKGNLIVRNSVPVFMYAGNVGSYQHYAVPFFELLKKTACEFHFKIFTNSPAIFEDGLNSISTKVSICPYLEREDLLVELERADFLVYFPYKHSTQKSMKLIDYGYTGKPILEYTATTKDDLIFKEFLEKKYSHSLPKVEIDEYKIEHVSQQFLSLVPELK